MHDHTLDPLPVVQMEDDLLHTVEHPFCFLDEQCPCHEDHVLIGEVTQAVTDGLLTPGEAANFVAGRLL
ncbi:MAG TPA: hypothetical protein VIY29_28070 [Ktedonobacteraceae bacterium]